MTRLLLPLLLLTTACNREERPEPPTAAESARLNDAEEMLNDLAKEEGPAANAADPSLNSD